MTLCSKEKESEEHEILSRWEKKKNRYIVPEEQVWGNRYTGEADTSGQGQIPCPTVCMCEVVLSVVTDSEIEKGRDRETVRNQTQVNSKCASGTGMTFRGQGLVGDIMAGEGHEEEG